MGYEENPIVGHCLHLLRVFGFDAWRQNQVPVRGRRFLGKCGVGDILGVSPRGRFTSVEAKKEDGEPSDDQLEFVEEVNKRGGLAVIVKSSRELYEYLEKKRKELGEL